MNKERFLRMLRAKLSGLEREDIEKSVEYYSEMIDDRIEDGYTELDAVRAVGSVDEAADRIFSECSLLSITKRRIAKVARQSSFKTVVVIATSPIWVPVLIALMAVVLSLAVAVAAIVFSVVIALFAVDIALFAASIGLIGVSVVYVIEGAFGATATLIGGGMVMLGVAILLFSACKVLGVGAFKLVKGLLLGIKKLIIKSI